MATDMNDVRVQLSDDHYDDDKVRDQQQEPADEIGATHPLPALFRRIAVFEMVKAACLCGVYYALDGELSGVHHLAAPVVCQLLGIVGTLLWIAYGQPQATLLLLLPCALILPFYLLGGSYSAWLGVLYISLGADTGAAPAGRIAPKIMAGLGVLVTGAGLFLVALWVAAQTVTSYQILVSQPAFMLMPLLAIAGSYMVECSGERVVVAVSAAPGRMAITVFDACCQYLRQDRSTRHATTFWQHGAARYGQAWAADVGVWVCLSAMTLPMSLVWMYGEYTFGVLALKVPTLSECFPFIALMLCMAVSGAWEQAASTKPRTQKPAASHPMAGRKPDFVITSLGCVRGGSRLGLVPLVGSIALAFLDSSATNSAVGWKIVLLLLLVQALACALVLLGCVWFVAFEAPKSLKSMVTVLCMTVGAVGHLLTTSSKRALRLTDDQQLWMCTILAGVAVVFFYQVARRWPQQRPTETLATAVAA